MVSRCGTLAKRQMVGAFRSSRWCWQKGRRRVRPARSRSTSVTAPSVYSWGRCRAGEGMAPPYMIASHVALSIAIVVGLSR